MKKRAAALSMALLMAASTCFPAQAGWTSWDGIWRYADSTGEFEKNVLRPSGGRWFWIGEDACLKTGYEGETVKTDLNGNVYILTLNDDGSAKPTCRDEEGNTYDLYELIGPGNGIGFKPHASEWREVQESANHPHAWIYNDETGKPIGTGVQEVNGFLYYFDEDGEIKSIGSAGLQDGHYVEPYDFIMAVNKWIPYDGNWYYFDENGNQVTGEREIDGIRYDFGTNGYLSGDEVSFPLVTSVKLGEYPDKAYVGDVVEIPFTVEVEQQLASPSNATDSNAIEADYSMFQSFYAVGNENRYNLWTGNCDGEVNPQKYNKSAMERRYEIDWDNQVIRVPIDREGTAYGTLRIPNTYDAAAWAGISDPDGFIIRCYYPESMSGEDKAKDILENLEADEAVASLKNQDNEELKEAFLNNSEITAQIKELEYMNGQEKAIKTYVNAENVKEQINPAAMRVVGLGLLGEKNTEIGLHVDTPKETIPQELSDKNTAAFDLKVMNNGTEKNNLEIPIVITMPVPKGIVSASFELYHIKDGAAEEIPYIYDGEAKTATFAADSFSTYVFAEEKNTSDNNGGGSSGGNSSGSSSSGSSDSDSGNSGVASSLKRAAGSWKYDDRGWWFKNSDGSYPTNIWQLLSYEQKAAWYHFDAEGYMQTGWFKDTDGKWYYLNPAADGTCGSMVTGWKWIDGYWYYFNEKSDGYLGALVMNGRTPDGYIVDEQGRWIQ